MTDRGGTVIVVGVLAILFVVLGLLRVADMYLEQKRRAEKYEAQLIKTEGKLDYYIWRESKSLGHSVGPDKYPGRETQ